VLEKTVNLLGAQHLLNVKLVCAYHDFSLYILRDVNILPNFLLTLMF
jgi:hypothetical protein